MTDNLPPLPSHPEHGWVWTEAEKRAGRTGSSYDRHPTMEEAIERVRPKRLAQAA